MDRQRREAERAAAAATGDPEALARLERERLRAGELTVFACARCGAALSAPLQRLLDPSRLCWEDGEPYLPRGWCWREDEGHLAGTWALHLEDARGTAHTRAAGRLQGCCGVDGSSGFTTVCASCRTEVGTERSDCWMPHALYLDPTRIRT
jgi:hypothetical protein